MSGIDRAYGFWQAEKEGMSKVPSKENCKSAECSIQLAIGDRRLA
jgi:hypothetical protein